LKERAQFKLIISNILIEWSKIRNHRSQTAALGSLEFKVQTSLK